MPEQEKNRVTGIFSDPPPAIIYNPVQLSLQLRSIQPSFTYAYTPQHCARGHRRQSVTREETGIAS